MISLVVLASLVAISLSHAAYAREFNLTVTNQSISSTPGSNVVVYTGTLRYRNLYNSTVYLLLNVGSNYGIGTYGFGNQTLIGNGVRCGREIYPCQVNTNRIVLNPNNDTYKITAEFIRAQNQTIYGGSVLLYNGNYTYIPSMT